MKEIAYLCLPCGKGDHRRCALDAFYELQTDLVTLRQTKHAVECECPHIIAASPDAAAEEAR